MDNQLGDTIIKLRKEKGFTQEKFAELLDVSRQTVSKWENGVVQPNNENIKLICETLNVTVETLFSETACVSDSPYDSKTNSSSKKRNLFYLIGIIVLSVVIIWMITLTVVLGLITFKPNTDNLYKNSDIINKFIFYILLAETLILVVVDLILVVVMLKNMKTSKRKFNDN